MQVLFHLGFVLLALELLHLLSVLILLAREVVLEPLVFSGRGLNVLCQIALLLFQEFILTKLITLIVDNAAEARKIVLAHHFLDHIVRGLDERLLMSLNLLLVVLYSRLLLQLFAQLFSAILKLFGDALQ